MIRITHTAVVIADTTRTGFMSLLQKHVRAERSATKACAKRLDVSPAEKASVERHACNKYALDHANVPDICFWSCTFLSDENSVKNANYSILGSIPIDNHHSAVWFDATLVQSDMMIEDCKQTIEAFGYGFEVSNIADGSLLRAEVFVRSQLD